MGAGLGMRMSPTFRWEGVERHFTARRRRRVFPALLMDVSPRIFFLTKKPRNFWMASPAKSA